MQSRPIHRFASPLAVLPALAVFAALVCSACVDLEQPYLERHFHLVEAPRPTESAAIPAAAQRDAAVEVLLVRPFAISPSFEGRGLVYKRIDGTFESDYYDEFFVSPAAMLTQLARDWIANAALVATVIDSGSALEPTLVLEGSVAQLFGDYTTGAEPEAVVALELLVLRRSRAGSQVLFQRDYTEREPARGLGPDALVEAWGRGVTRILAQFEQDLSPSL